MKQRCPQCGKEKELNLENFYRDRARKTGFQGACKACKTKNLKPYVPTGQRLSDKGKAQARSVAFDEACFREELRRGQGSAVSCDRQIEVAIPLARNNEDVSYEEL